MILNKDEKGNFDYSNNFGNNNTINGNILFHSKDNIIQKYLKEDNRFFTKHKNIITVGVAIITTVIDLAGLFV